MASSELIEPGSAVLEDGLTKKKRGPNRSNFLSALLMSRAAYISMIPRRACCAVCQVSFALILTTTLSGISFFLPNAFHKMDLLEILPDSPARKVRWAARSSIL